jgi:NAD(P)-dependent dehydrogenase (short-subunit alcohol dehydrogenase family)
VAAEIDGAFAATDVTDPDQVSAAVAIATEMGPLRALVCCAGIGPPARTLNRDGTPHDLDQFSTVIRVNLIGTFNSIRLAAAAMAATDRSTNRAAAAPSSTPLRWRRSTAKSARPPTRPRREAWWG